MFYFEVTVEMKSKSQNEMDLCQPELSILLSEYLRDLLTSFISIDYNTFHLDHCNGIFLISLPASLLAPCNISLPFIDFQYVKGKF